jgi:hypothetical protein
MLLAMSGCANYQETTSPSASGPSVAISPSVAASPSVTVTSTVAKPPPSNPALTPKDPLEETVLEADCIVKGKIVDQRDEVIQVGEGKSAGTQTYRIFKLAVDKMIKGDPDVKELFIKTSPGIVGAPIFQISEIILVCLSKEHDDIFVVFGYNSPLPDGRMSIEGDWAVLWDTMDENQRSLVDPDHIIGRIISIMKLNNIPIALSEKERPPEPAGPITRPTPLRSK